MKGGRFWPVRRRISIGPFPRSKVSLRRMAPLFLVVALALVTVSSLSCAGEDSGEAATRGTDRTRVVTTLPLFVDFIRQIGGDRVDVFALFPSGADPHTFEPKPKDVERVTQASLIVINGLGLEEAAERLIERNARVGVPVVELAEGAAARGAVVLKDQYTEAGEDQTGNPHLWLDAGNAREYASLIAAALSQVDSAGAPEYEAGRQRFLKEIDEADAYARRKVQTVPAVWRKLITTHEAFPYFARYFGLEIVAFVSASPGQETTSQRVAELRRAISDEGIPAVFAEPQLGPEGRVLKRAAEEAGAKMCTLYSDSLDKSVQSYVELIRFNADQIAECLGGKDG